MADNNLNKRFFTNTYITGSGRQNYLRIDNLEDPLFTSFTFDIDYTTSPLFYTINNSYFNCANDIGLAEQIEDALNNMYNTYMGKDQGYDILPILSGNMIDGTKLGFGLQQNVYMDLPLYGATEYIYMVDKRNGRADQNDVNNVSNSGINPNANSFKLGDSVKSIVNDSDKAWTERIESQNSDMIKDCDKILNDSKVKEEHDKNKAEYETALTEYENAKKTSKSENEGNNSNDVYDKESEIRQKIDECKEIAAEFDKLKSDIVDWANSILSDYQNKGTQIYNSNECIQDIFSEKIKTRKDLTKKYGTDVNSKYLFNGPDYRSKSSTSYSVKFWYLYNELVTYTGANGYKNGVEDDNESFLLDTTRSDSKSSIRDSKIIEKFKNRLENLGLLNNGILNGKVYAVYAAQAPEWAYKLKSHVSKFLEDETEINTFIANVDSMIQSLMRYQCDINLSFDENFTSDKIKKNAEDLDKYKIELENINFELYGYANGSTCDKSNSSPDSLYGKYLAAKEKFENDDYSQAEKSKALAESGQRVMKYMINEYEANNTQKDIVIPEADPGASPVYVDEKKMNYAPQTVFDMLGFISGMKNMIEKYPYIIQSITGLDTAYNKHYVVKDPYLGSGEDKITLTCLESLDLRVSSMFNRYFNAVYDRQYRRERVPVNLRRFNCSVYVHDVRNFVSNMRQTENRILELTDMYYSVIEFKFYDCEIVSEETGNIFNDISNEAPSEMKKTNFTFTYGNCVVNFIPNSRISAYKNRKL